MRNEPLSREWNDEEAAGDIQIMMQAATLMAGIAIAMAAMGCNVADEADLHAAPADQNTNVAHAAPQPGATQGNVQDMTY